MPSIPRKPTTFLIQAFDLSAWPVVLFGEGNTVRYLNPAAERALGTPRDELLEQTARYHGLGQLPKALQQVSDLCPASNVWLGEVATREITLAAGADADETNWRGIFYPITDAPDTEAVALVRNVVVMLAPPEKYPNWGPLQPQEEIHATLQALRHEYRGRYSVSHLVGISTAMIRVRRLVDLASQSRVPVLVIGEQGTGREQVARTICYASHPGHAGPVITIEGELMDAEIMQTTIRAFANRCQDDEDAGHASLLLLNAEKLDLGAQTELLHLLDLVGIDLRILSTSQESLLELARRGQFREDLAFRISTLEIELPPLCDRPEDIPYIAQAVVEELNIPSDRQLQSISTEAIDRLQQQEWPGNIDQLNEMLTAAHQIATGFTLDVTDFPAVVARTPQKKIEIREPEVVDLDAALEAYEREILVRTLKAAKGNKTQAANMLNISRARLHRRIEQWGLE
ncbi:MULTISPECIES: sigma 54-interacting transcriptional regulator [Pirellulaceae]|uniref:sigma 54-interacting transcriptional regulator n=1 Tax=Pirellulaceae TaxID=2691357 RepID=UPI0011AFE9B6|nr:MULTISPECIES: sigma 54-interacting transcriptional regulator [Pirellulaceae]